jgi:acetate kinase
MNETHILVLNTGSSSLKFSLFHVRPARGGSFARLLSGHIEQTGRRTSLQVSDAAGRPIAQSPVKEAPAQWAATALTFVEQWLREHFPNQRLIVGHRVVHGGMTFRKSVKITATVLRQLEQLVPLDPLHLPVSLTAIKTVRQRNPSVPQVACFDTAFHRTHSPLAELTAIPWKYYQAGVRRYGFHGLSYEYIASVLPQIAPRLARGRVIVAHLGSGASLCALKAGRSVDSSMGFSVLDGVPMGTRPGKIDPGILLYLLRHRGLTTHELESMLYHESGLLGLSGISADTRALLASRQPRARLAIDFFIYQVAQEIAALAATLSGIDGLVFTGGIGEHSQEIRAAIVQACAWLGIHLDARANRAGRSRISTAASPVSAWVIPTNEELMIARHTWKLSQTKPSRS